MNFSGLIKKINIQRSSTNLKKSDLLIILDNIKQSILSNNHKKIEILR